MPDVITCPSGLSGTSGRAEAPDFKAGIERLARERANAILCDEEAPGRCHRRLLVAPALGRASLFPDSGDYLAAVLLRDALLHQGGDDRDCARALRQDARALPRPVNLGALWSSGLAVKS